MFSRHCEQDIGFDLLFPWGLNMGALTPHWQLRCPPVSAWVLFLMPMAQPYAQCFILPSTVSKAIVPCCLGCAIHRVSTGDQNHHGYLLRRSGYPIHAILECDLSHVGDLLWYSLWWIPRQPACMMVLQAILPKITNRYTRR